MKKKEFMEKLKEEKGSIRINNFTKLNIYKKNVLGDDVDMIIVECSLGYRNSTTADIKSREYEEIMQEIKANIVEFTETLKTEAINDINAGYLFGTEVKL